MARLRTLVLVAVVLLVCAGCGMPAQPVASTTTPPAEAGVPTWTGDELLPAAGGMTRVGSIGVYFAVDVFRYTLVAVDVTTGAELWRHPVHQLGRIRGVPEVPTVDPVTELVLATASGADTASEPAPYLTALDLVTGEAAWSVPTVFARTTPELCGPGVVCVLGADGAVAVHSQTDGTVVGGGTALPVVLGGAGSLLVTADPDRGLVELGRLTAAGYQRTWQQPLAELTRVPDTYSPDGGWSAWVDGSTGAAVVSVGAAPDPGDTDGRTAAAKEVDVGWATAFLDPTGAVLDRATGLVPCFGLSRTVDRIPLCRVVESRAGTGEDDALFRLVDRLEMRTANGAQLWARDLEVAVDLDDVTSSAAPDTVVVPGPGGRTVLEAGDGIETPVSAGSEVSRCAPPLPEDALFVGLSTAGRGQILRYLRADPADLAQPCGADGVAIEVADLVAAGRSVPDGIGPSVIAPGAPADGADAWVVQMTVDGVLHGTGPLDG